MPRFRATFCFKDTAGAGWSETIYNTAGDMTTMVARAQNIIPLRVALLGAESALPFCRLSDDLVKRDSQVIYVSPGSQKNIRGSASNLANDDVLVRLEGNDVPNPWIVRRSLALRGCAVNITGAAGVFVGTAAFTRDFQNYYTELTRAGWAIRYRARLAVNFDITDAQISYPSGVVTVTTALAHGLVQGDVVRITKVLGATQINGLWTINAPTTATTFKIKINVLMFPYEGNGTVNAQAFNLAAINNFAIVKCSTHKAGVPFDRLRGRRRARTRG